MGINKDTRVENILGFHKVERIIVLLLLKIRVPKKNKEKNNGRGRVMDWEIGVDRFFHIMSVLENKQVNMVEIRQNSNVVVWYSPQNIFESTRDNEKSTTTKDSNLENKGSGNPIGVQKSKASDQRKNNPYVKPTRDTCYHYNGRCHKLNVSPTMRFTTIEEEMEEEKEK
ncbi:hypothetical protein KIW84_036057 [Lathyrus oleraceus]|uniref:Uncharacterized protein n=1 Tax=Pisum sativum TaxID=3888 RepID=A0A9D4Y8M3_PEA|nr:hypothetical protein KIW84_036057 [Pisum sativum]